jgi:uncharacterized RDD family membrane protein YckC
MDRIQFSTPEDVELGYELAGPASRFGAHIFDRLILIMWQLLGLGLLALIAFFTDSVVSGGWSLGNVVMVLFIGFSEFAYFGLYEWRCNGLTPGKMRVGVRVAMDGGFSLTPTAVILRTLIRPVDLIPLFWLIPLLDKKARRLGDLVAGTIVMRIPKEADISTPLPELSYTELETRHLELGITQLGRLKRTEYASLEEFLLRAPDLAVHRRSQLSRQIVSSLTRRMEIEMPRDVAAYELLKEIYLAMRAHSKVLAED